MSFLVTPGQLSQRAELYQQLSQLTAAGVGLPQAIELQQRSPPARSFHGPLAIVTRRLAYGATFHEALQSTGRWLPAFDSALLQAGEQSGRLPACFTLLAGSQGWGLGGIWAGLVAFVAIRTVGCLWRTAGGRWAIIGH